MRKTRRSFIKTLAISATGAMILPKKASPFIGDPDCWAIRPGDSWGTDLCTETVNALKPEYLRNDIIYGRSYCIRCGSCVDACRLKAIKLGDLSQMLIIDKDECIGCRLCIKRCPTNALKRWYGEDYTNYKEQWDLLYIYIYI